MVKVVQRWGVRYVGVFLLSAATLMFQVSYTRILSVALWHHFVWMVVSIALLGYAASGTLLSIYPKLQEQDLNAMLGVTSVLFSASMILSYWMLNRIPFDPQRLSWDRLQLIYITAYYILLSIPFLLSGTAVALVMNRAGHRINRLYFSNLVGSALGSILVIPLFAAFTGPTMIIVSSIIAGVSAISFSMNLNGRLRATTVGWTVLLLVLLPSASVAIPVRMSPYKNLMVALRYPGARLLETRWNAFSRVDVVESGLVRFAPGLSLSYGGVLPQQIGVVVDGDDLDAITNYGGDASSLVFTEFLPTALPYRLRDSPRTLIIEAGGGLEVLKALHHGSTEITAVEANPIIVRLVQGDYDEYAGSIYRDERVGVVVDQGRSFVKASGGVYELIELPMAHGASASSTGVYALSENYLYTVEAFEELLSHLAVDGLLCVSTWLLPPPREDVRIVSLAMTALEGIGARKPSEHLAVIRTWGTMTVLAGRSPLEEWDINAVRDFCGEMGFDVVYVPGVGEDEVNIYNVFPEPIYHDIVKGVVEAEDRGEFYENYLFDIGPTTDEKPFFFHFFKWDRLLETYESMGMKWQALIEGGYLVPIALLQALALSIVFILLPLRSHRRALTGGGWGLLAYFFCLGLGYMFVELASIQRLILLLGHPSYSISVVIFSLLTASGIGSYVSKRFEPAGRAHKITLAAICLLAPLYGLSSPMIRYLLGLPLLARLVAVFIIVAPLGVLMGMPFPLGIGLLAESRSSLIPWAWAVNGCASVIGSIVPTMIALSFGFSTVFALAGAAYLVSLLMVLRVK